MNNLLPFTCTRCARKDTRWVHNGDNHLRTLKAPARRRERRNRRQQDHCGNFDWTPRFRGVTGHDVC